MRLSEALEKNETVAIEPKRGIRLSEALSPEKAGVEEQFRSKTPFLFGPSKPLGHSLAGKSLKEVIAESVAVGQTPEYKEREQEYAKKIQAVAEGFLPLGPDEWKISAEKYPIAKAVGSVVGLIGTGALTKGIAPAVAFSKQLAALPTVARMAAGRMAQTGATFGLKELADNMAEMTSGEEKEFQTIVIDTLTATGFGAGLGAVGSIASPVARIPAQANPWGENLYPSPHRTRLSELRFLFNHSRGYS